MISLFYITDDDGKVRIRNSGIDGFDSFQIEYIMYSDSFASAYFQDLSGNEIARVAIDIKYDRELLDIVKNTRNVFDPVSREEFVDWMRENHPDILTYLLWYIT